MILTYIMELFSITVKKGDPQQSNALPYQGADLNTIITILKRVTGEPSPCHTHFAFLSIIQ